MRHDDDGFDPTGADADALLEWALAVDTARAAAPRLAALRQQRERLVRGGVAMRTLYARYLRETSVLSPGFLWKHFVRHGDYVPALLENPRFADAASRDLVDYLAARLYRTDLSPHDRDVIGESVLALARDGRLGHAGTGLPKLVQHLLRRPLHSAGMNAVFLAVLMVRDLAPETLATLVARHAAHPDAAVAVMHPAATAGTWRAAACEEACRDVAVTLSSRAGARADPQVGPWLWARAENDPAIATWFLLDVPTESFERCWLDLLDRSPELALGILRRREDLPPLPSSAVRRLLELPDRELRSRAASELGRLNVYDDRRGPRR